MTRVFKARIILGVRESDGVATKREERHSLLRNQGAQHRQRGREQLRQETTVRRRMSHKASAETVFFIGRIEPEPDESVRCC
jgi:hypothetical protein